MLNRKKVFILILFLLLIVLVLIFLTFQKKPITNPSSPTPSPIISTSQPSPFNQFSPISTLKVTPSDTLPLDLVVAYPPEDPRGEKRYSPIKPVSFTFTKELNPQSISYKINPPIETQLTHNYPSSTFTIEPKGLDYWKPNIIYTITINSNLRALDGSTLTKEVIYQIQAKTQGGE